MLTMPGIVVLFGNESFGLVDSDIKESDGGDYQGKVAL
jgi:hypothetical protein